LRIFSALLGEALIFGCFFFFFDYHILFFVYLYAAPFVFAMILYLFRTGLPVKKNFLSKDLLLLIAVIVAWLYVYALVKQSTVYVLSITYYPAILEELNFRFIIPEMLSRKTGMGKALIIQALLYTIFYMGLPVLKPGSYPGVYLYFFIFDNFATSLFYGAIYYLRKSIYLDIALHMSFYLIEIFLTTSTAWIGAALAPV
jgi:CAAX amino terminal protease family.